ncbi:hypothetical protein [Pirellula sp. SH-Sr6A]|uniref:hypothetical protein n=1 Tax=Pirellula sp. SH-Sr6A TaxID=1632865 RepID=UPI0011BA624B|nr:hypothetical protein [Pirellula sp. SH-Sr6A]
MARQLDPRCTQESLFPKLPFVIGVMGFGGLKDRSPDVVAFRKAMAAPAEMREFQVKVVAVHTAPFGRTSSERSATCVTASIKCDTLLNQNTKITPMPTTA